MELEDKQFAEKALKRLFIGSQLDGIKFGITPGGTFLYFVHYTDKEPDKLWLNIEVNKFSILPFHIQGPLADPQKMMELNEEEAIKKVLEVRRETVVDIRLGDISPHLFIYFQSGKTLFVNGHHEEYECWQAGDGEGYTGDEWLAVAVPGNEIAIWTPEEND